MVVRRCLVPCCNNTSLNASQKLFIRIPKSSNIKEKWYEAIKQEKVLKGPHGFVCEDHFDLQNDTENWDEYKLIGGRLRIKNHVVPHLNIESINTDFMLSQLSDSARKRKQDIQKTFVSRKKLMFDEPSTSAYKEDEDIVIEYCTTVYNNEITPIDPTTENQHLQISKSTKDIGTQTSFKNQKHTEEHTLISDSTSSSPTESDTISLYVPSSSTDISPQKKIQHPISRQKGSKHSEKQNNEIISITNIERNTRLYLGLPEKEYFIIQLITEKMDLNYKYILITLKKIRLNDSYSRIAVEFGISTTTVSRIITSSLPKLSVFFKDFIYWPDAHTIKLKLPIHFSVRYRNVQSVIDCLEVEIQTPSDPYIQAQTWSNYKKCNTIKYLISATPHGFINFVSAGYGGRTTDTDIIEKSEYINILPTNSGVMADRGFKNISNLLLQKNSILIRPPSTTSDKKFSKEEALETKRIAALRIHIERVIRRLREYKMLAPHACIHSKLVPWLDHIVIIGCGLVNIQGSLIK